MKLGSREAAVIVGGEVSEAVQTVHPYCPYIQPRSGFDGWPHYSQRLSPGEPMYGRAPDVGLWSSSGNS